MHGTSKRIADALFAEYFHNFDMRDEIYITASGDGEESRSVRIYRGARAVARLKGKTRQGGDPVDLRSVNFEWEDSKGKKHNIVPTVSSEGISFPDTGEDLPDFSYFSAMHTQPALDNAERFSELSRRDRKAEFLETLQTAYPWIQDLTIEVAGGISAIYATVEGLKNKLPLGSVSGGVNKVVSALLSIAHRQRSIVLFDELENGIFYSHHETIWKALITFASKYEGQIFLTTHSAEWLRALVAAAGDNTENIALWRIERDDAGRPILFSFDGPTIKDAIEHGAEARGA